jgi:predicted exporter
MFFLTLNRKGSAFFAVFGVLFLLATIFFFVYFLAQPRPGAPGAKGSKADPQDAKIERVQGEIFQLYTSIMEAEKMRDRRKYLEITGVAAQKVLEADDLWEQKTKSQKGLADGLMGGFNENYEARFMRADKFQMLSEKYGLPPERLRALKADIEVMFTDELAEKFAPMPEGEEVPAEAPTKAPAKGNKLQ